MRAGAIVALVVALLVVPVMTHGIQMRAEAQDATPAASPQAEGVTIRPLASGSVQVLNPGTALLNLGRVSLAPGASVPFNPNQPAAILVYVASGELTFQVDAPMTVARRAEPGTPVPPAPESVEANTAFTLRDGDSALFPPAINGEVRNEGNDEASAWVVNFAIQAAGAGTPAAGTPAP